MAGKMRSNACRVQICVADTCFTSHSGSLTACTILHEQNVFRIWLNGFNWGTGCENCLKTCVY